MPPNDKKTGSANGLKPLMLLITLANPPSQSEPSLGATPAVYSSTESPLPPPTTTVPTTSRPCSKRHLRSVGAKGGNRPFFGCLVMRNNANSLRRHPSVDLTKGASLFVLLVRQHPLPCQHFSRRVLVPVSVSSAPLSLAQDESFSRRDFKLPRRTIHICN